MGSLLLHCLLALAAQEGVAPDVVQAPDLSPPVVEGRSAFVSQVGSDNTATIRQSASRARAEVVQQGDGNALDAAQDDRGVAYLRTRQDGEANRIAATQTGSGTVSLWIDQTGGANRAAVSQTTYGALYNGAALAQAGQDNSLSLVQNGADNRAVLAQTGDGNAMSAVQNGAGNRLAWVQQGNGLSDLSIVQNGGQSLLVTQTGGR